MSIDPDTRRAALIATAVTLPIVLIAALIFGNAKDAGPKGSSGAASSGAPLPPISVSAGPIPAAADAACTALLSALPVAIPTSNGAINSRPVHATSTYVVAWGNPAIVLQCGVPRPAKLLPNSADLLVLVDGVNWLPTHPKGANVFTTVDRSAYISVSVPTSYAQPPLGPLADAISQALPAVCTVPEENGTATPPTATLCTYRK